MHHDLQPGKHLLLDHAAVADTYRLRRVVHQPRREPAEPVLAPVLDWEGQTVTPLRVDYLGPQQGYRMWYQAHDQRVEAERKALGKSQYGNVGEPQPIYLCYATSRDGITWDRPALDVYKHRDGTATNIIFKGYSYSAGNTIIDHPDPAAKDRFVLVNCDWQSEQVGGIHLATSPDGIHWQYAPGKPVIHGESDTWNCLTWNQQRGVYMLYMRAWHSAAWGWTNETLGNRRNLGPWKDNSRRRVSYSESKDLTHWTEPQIMLSPDELDYQDFYGFQAFRYANYYLAFLWHYDGDGGETIDSELVWSQDGFHWQRHPQRPRFLPRGKKGEPDGYMIIPAQQPTVAGDAMYLYYTGHCGPHDGSESPAVAYRTRMRLDGFVSLEAERLPGTLITQPFTLQSDQISINAATHSDGHIVAELVEPWWYDPTGKAVEGFAAKDFVHFQGDSLKHPLTWRGGSDLRALKGKRLMLRLALQHAEIYSITL